MSKLCAFVSRKIKINVYVVKHFKYFVVCISLFPKRKKKKSLPHGFVPASCSLLLKHRGEWHPKLKFSLFCVLCQNHRHLFWKII